MDPLLAFLAIFGTSTAIYLFSIGTGIVMDRWSRSAGLDSGKWISSARLAAGMACIIYSAALGAFVAVHDFGRAALAALLTPVVVVGRRDPGELGPRGHLRCARRAELGPDRDRQTQERSAPRAVRPR